MNCTLPNLESNTYIFHGPLNVEVLLVYCLLRNENRQQSPRIEDITFYSSDFVGKDMYDCEDIPIIDHGHGN